ncbi:AAA family ATPase [Candidatus Gottesmanbacteria bacterium]|nr:AAA family ATPase [Candidatus Gottesmanbacteria bacterium]
MERKVHSEAGLQSEQQHRAIPIRTENPLIATLPCDAVHVQGFATTVNNVIALYNGITIEAPYTGELPKHPYTPFKVVQIPYVAGSEQKTQSLREVWKDLHQNQEIREGLFFDLPVRSTILTPLIYPLRSPQLYYFLASTVIREHHNPYQGEGVFLKGKREKPVIGTWKVQARKLHSQIPKEGTLEIHDFGSLSEVELAYATVMASLVSAGSVDLSTAEKMTQTLPLRREIFVSIYKGMLKEMMPEVEKEEIYGLDSQIGDIEMNLYGPLRRRSGIPMSTLLVGAPGVGKSLVGRLFATDTDNGVLTIPVSIRTLLKVDNEGESVFKNYVLPRLTRIKTGFGIPFVLLIDDVEAILKEGMTTGPVGQKAESINPEKRSETLTLLERLQDTYGVFLLCTLNNPDVEAAFLRRFNPVYFPLPDSNQRRYTLEQVIGRGPLAEEEYQDFLNRLTQDTDRFNYHGLTMISQYQHNILLPKKGEDVEPETYKHSIIEAMRKAGERTNLQGLAEFDEIAKTMVGQTKSQQLGFNTETRGTT